MTSLTIDDGVLPSLGLDLAVLRQDSVKRHEGLRPEAKTTQEERAQKLACPVDKGQWRVLRYL